MFEQSFFSVLLLGFGKALFSVSLVVRSHAANCPVRFCVCFKQFYKNALKKTWGSALLDLNCHREALMTACCGSCPCQALSMVTGEVTEVAPYVTVVWSAQHQSVHTWRHERTVLLCLRFTVFQSILQFSDAFITVIRAGNCIYLNLQLICLSEHLVSLIFKMAGY